MVFNLKSKTCRQRSRRIQNRKLAGIVALVLTLTMCVAVAGAQQPPKIPRIGWLSGSSRAAIATRSEAFRQGLRELGYVEGKNIVIDYRWANGKFEQVPAQRPKW